jgi:hypothetical protein
MDRDDESSVPWFARRRSRFLDDVDDMLWRFPRFGYAISGGEVVWRGPVAVLTPLGAIKHEGLKVVCRGDYPNQAPRAYKESGFPGGQRQPRHVYRDQALCVYCVDDSPEKRWTPEDSLVTFVAWACEWLHCYYWWLQIGGKRKWLGEEAPHK